eukprot:CAMPEP_0175217130 /NCGR_PEP_ID=MMETSP0093-20121207/18083_1 /TAXON_ID=311494 /ORGANISM="Alexandrium monilatum, Strain CCMP3105" /LENGTH=206 /DNA_ID=CAMNT_0016510543 /DNA_START=59 /DNA_END=677 /DNA_ORIENTATION=-
MPAPLTPRLSPTYVSAGARPPRAGNVRRVLQSQMEPVLDGLVGGRDRNEPLCGALGVVRILVRMVVSRQAAVVPPNHVMGRGLSQAKRLEVLLELWVLCLLLSWHLRVSLGLLEGPADPRGALAGRPDLAIASEVYLQLLVGPGLGLGRQGGAEARVAVEEALHAGAPLQAAGGRAPERAVPARGPALALAGVFGAAAEAGLEAAG